MLFRSLRYWSLLVPLFALPLAAYCGEDTSPAAAVPKADSDAKVADDPAAVEAFKKAERYRYCKRDKDGNVTVVDLNWPQSFEKPDAHELRLHCLENLKGFPKLRTILLNTDNPNEELGFIGELTTLETLVVDHTELTDISLVAIQRMTCLKRLSLRGSYKLTDGGLEHLAGLKSLEDLDLSHTHVRGSGLRMLTGLESLKKLNLDGSRLADAEMADVASLAALEELDLTSTKITPASLGELSRLTHLRSLHLLVTGITASSVEGLKKSLPKLEIELPSTYVRKETRDPRVEAMEKAIQEMEPDVPKRPLPKPSARSDP